MAVDFAQQGEQWELSLSDNGVGMDADTARPALKGGFSTKSHGTGLGLCRHILALMVRR